MPLALPFFPPPILRRDDPSFPISCLFLPLQLSTSQPLLFSPHTHPLLHLSSLRRLLARQLNRLSDNRAPLLLPLFLSPLSMHSSSSCRSSSEAEGPGLSNSQALYIEASMGLYAASARPCPRRHQSSSAPGLLSLPRQAANRSLPGSSIGDGEKSRAEEGERISLCLFALI